MDTELTCVACGQTGYDVRSRIVEANADNTITVLGNEVPERYRRESHCIDRDACLERQPSIRKDP
jgi:hypothetical protein